MRSLPSVKNLLILDGQVVLLRASLNVPIKDGQVANTFRIKRALPTIKYLISKKAKVIVIAHIGREREESLKPVFDVLKDMIPVKWCGGLSSNEVKRQATELKAGEVLLLENLRSDERETTNDAEFAKELASLAAIYVNDAFAASHREHTSLVGIPKFLPAYFGFNFLHEYEALSKAMEPASPSLFVLGGAKFETKLPLVDAYAKKYTNVFIGGALANDMFKAVGLEVGESLVSDIDLTKTNVLAHENLIVPSDVIVKGKRGIRACAKNEVLEHESILDAGPNSVDALRPFIMAAKFILWNGPLGNYELGFKEQTEGLAKMIAESPAFSVVGGGDTIAAIEGLGLQDKFGFLSTAGGAMLSFLEVGTLPAIEAVMDK